MSKQILSGWEEDDNNISVLLISTHLDDFRLAYSLNKHCLTQFVNISNISQKLGQNKPLAQFLNPQDSTFSRSYLIHNQRQFKNKATIPHNLFAQPEPVTLPLIKSYAKWPYFIVSSSETIQELIKRIPLAPHIIACQLIEFQSLSKNDQNIIYNIYNED